MDQLAFDLLFYVHEPNAQALLVRIEERIDTDAAPSVEQGSIRCLVEEVLQGNVPLASHLWVRFTRMKEPLTRAKASANHWNALRLDVGERLLLVGKSMEGGDWKALAGNQVSSSTDPVVRALRECYRIQALEKGSREQQAALRTALVATHPLVRRYSLEGISRHDLVSREAACAMIVDVLKTETVERESLLRFADVLTSIPIFDSDKQTDEVNRTAVVNVAAIVERLINPADKVTCVRYLSSCIMAKFAADTVENLKVRTALLKAIGDKPPKAVAETLTTMSSGNSADDKVIANDLVSAWSAAR